MAAAGCFILLIAILFIFARAELSVRVREIFAPRTAMSWMDKEQKRVARHVFRFAAPLTGLRIEAEPFRGGRLPEVFLLISNHQSLADIPALIHAFPRHSLRFVTKRELGYGIPMISYYLKKGGHALISRHGNYGEGKREMIRLARLSGKGICPVIFPEGSRTRTGNLRRFQTGAFRTVLENARLPVVSVAIDGGYSISRLGTLFSRIGGTVYRVKPLRVYPPPAGKQEMLELLAMIEKDISSQIEEWRRI